MNRSHYLKYHPEEIILRDHLAIERTALANERTLLAYMRTVIGSVAVGATFLKIFHDPFLHIMGWFFILFSLPLFVTGFLRYARIEILLSAIEHQNHRHDEGDWMHQIMWSLVHKFNLAPAKD